MNFFENLAKVFTNSEYRTYMFRGFANTLIITIVAALIGLALGFLIAIIKILAKNNKKLFIPNLICKAYTTIIRGTPIALQLFIAVFAIFAIPGFKTYAVILCFGINSGAYVSESVRAGILSVDNGQMEAGRSLGLHEFTTLRKIILPQAIKNVIPAIGNELISLLKETAIISMVGSTVGTLTFDLNYASKTVSLGLSDFFAPSLVAAAFYLIVVLLISFGIRKIEKHYAKRDLVQ